MPNQELALIDVASAQGQSFSKFRAIFHQFWHSNFMAYSAIVSLALGLFQDFGTTRPAGQPPVDLANP
jgi:hypothetical protein